MKIDNPTWLPTDYSLELTQDNTSRGGQHVGIPVRKMYGKIYNHYGQEVLSAMVFSRSQYRARQTILEMLEYGFGNGRHI